MAIGLLQGTISPALWPNFANLIMAKEIWDALKVRFRKAGEAQTYLQLVNIITIKMTNLENLLTQVQEFQENYMRILANSHSAFSKDLITFTFCSTLLSSYKETAHQSLDDITKYTLSDIITWVLQEENRWKANSIDGGSSLNKFFTVKNLNQKCVKYGKMNHSTQNHWERANIQKKAKGNTFLKHQLCWVVERKKGKEKKRLKKALMYYQSLRYQK